MKMQRDALYLFLCHLEWHQRRNLEAYKELVAALDDQDPDIREVAESLLHRPSPRAQQKKQQPAHAASGRRGGQWKGKADRHVS